MTTIEAFGDLDLRLFPSGPNKEAIARHLEALNLRARLNRRGVDRGLGRGLGINWGRESARGCGDFDACGAIACRGLLGNGRKSNTPLTGRNAFKLDLIGINGVARFKFNHQTGRLRVKLSNAQRFDARCIANCLNELFTAKLCPWQIDDQTTGIGYQLGAGLDPFVCCKFELILLSVVAPIY